MSGTALLALLIAVWVLVGLIVAVVMGRRGHDPVTWGLLGATLGPLVVPVAIDRVLVARRMAAPRRLLKRRGAGGPVDVLIGVDGSPEAEAALRASVRLLGPRLGRLTLAIVIDYDLAEANPRWTIRDEAGVILDRLATKVCQYQPETMILPGHPARALADHAINNGYEVIAVGKRGTGLSKALVGSVASQLAGEATVPVLMASSPAGDHGPSKVQVSAQRPGTWSG